jgi:hypothetical protein
VKKTPIATSQHQRGDYRYVFQFEQAFRKEKVKESESTRSVGYGTCDSASRKNRIEITGITKVVSINTADDFILNVH